MHHTAFHKSNKCMLRHATNETNWRNSTYLTSNLGEVLPILLHRPNSNVGHDKESTATFGQTYESVTKIGRFKALPQNNTLHEEPSHSPCFPNRFTCRVSLQKKACMKSCMHLSVSCTLRKEALIPVEFRNSLRNRFDEHVPAMIL